MASYTACECQSRPVILHSETASSRPLRAQAQPFFPARHYFAEINSTVSAEDAGSRGWDSPQDSKTPKSSKFKVSKTYHALARSSVDQREATPSASSHKEPCGAVCTWSRLESPPGWDAGLPLLMLTDPEGKVWYLEDLKEYLTHWDSDYYWMDESRWENVAW